MEVVTHERNSLYRNEQQNNFIKYHNATVSYK